MERQPFLVGRVLKNNAFLFLHRGEKEIFSNQVSVIEDFTCESIDDINSFEDFT